MLFSSARDILRRFSGLVGEVARRGYVNCRRCLCTFLAPSILVSASKLFLNYLPPLSPRSGRPTIRMVYRRNCPSVTSSIRHLWLSSKVLVIVFVSLRRLICERTIYRRHSGFPSRCRGASIPSDNVFEQFVATYREPRVRQSSLQALIFRTSSQRSHLSCRSPTIVFLSVELGGSGFDYVAAGYKPVLSTALAALSGHNTYHPMTVRWFHQQGRHSPLLSFWGSSHFRRCSLA